MPAISFSSLNTMILKEFRRKSFQNHKSAILERSGPMEMFELICSESPLLLLFQHNLLQPLNFRIRLLQRHIEQVVLPLNRNHFRLHCIIFLCPIFQPQKKVPKARKICQHYSHGRRACGRILEVRLGAIFCKLNMRKHCKSLRKRKFSCTLKFHRQAKTSTWCTSFLMDWAKEHIWRIRQFQKVGAWKPNKKPQMLLLLEFFFLFIQVSLPRSRLFIGVMLGVFLIQFCKLPVKVLVFFSNGLQFHLCFIQLV